MDIGENLDSFAALVEIIAKLRSPEGCPWDRAQTHASIKGNLVEEAYEVLEAIDEQDMSKLCEELGDLLMQIVLQSQMASEDKDFEISDVVRKINEKLEEWFEKPRTILKKLEQDVGIKFREMYRIKMNSMCCGAGGGVRAGYPDFSLRTASLRCDEANAVNADILTTECPFCWRNLFDANELYSHGMKVMGILQMITEYDLLEILEKPSEQDFMA